MRDELNRIIGILKTEVGSSHRKVKQCIKKILKINTSLGKICGVLREGAIRAKEIQKHLQVTIKIKVVLIDEVWVRIKGLKDKWGYGIGKVVPKSLFLYSFECLETRAKELIRETMLELKEKGISPKGWISDILPAYVWVIKEEFKESFHQLCKIHVLKNIGRIIKDIPDEFINVKEYAKKVKERMKGLYEKKEWVEMENGLKRIIKELSLFQGENKEQIKPLLEFLERYKEQFFPCYRYPEEEVPSTNNMIECVFSIYKPGYKVSKHYESVEGADDKFILFEVYHNFRRFEEGKRKGKSPIEIEGFKTITTDWSELIWGDYKNIPVSEIIKPIKIEGPQSLKVSTN